MICKNTSPKIMYLNLKPVATRATSCDHWRVPQVRFTVSLLLTAYLYALGLRWLVAHETFMRLHEPLKVT